MKLHRSRVCFRDFINVSKCFIKVVTAGTKLSDSSSGGPNCSIQTSPLAYRLGTGNNQVGQGTRCAGHFSFTRPSEKEGDKVTRDFSSDNDRDRLRLFQMSMLFLSA